ncbi:DUF6524 family protein [Thioalbus denitrificans]|uniref:Uncharacterized protein n=1 Tax=Thioalbus denitrificans TaxID=547122 RepID=A0A369CH32_9GAMM|nr:DUF6524 family protein [Thioalbus denitrificans]RCX33382.1 hypothetical protein DFQ59_101683 [Thioalbus denitrificans]
MAMKQFGGTGLLLRFLVGLVLVFASYNPEAWSYWHWALANLPDFSVLKAFVGVVLLIGWTIYLRATVRSLGPFGLILAVAFFGTLIWLLVDTGILPADSVRAVSYIVLVIISGVLAVGVSWSHVRRRITGQIDVDEIEED